MKKYKLLIVDDEFFIREGLMSFEWERLGFVAVASAANPKEAFEYIERNDIDVLLTDIKMPAFDGIQLCEYVKKRNESCELVLISGYRDFDYSKRAMRVGVFDYILKPIDMDELEKTFQRIKKHLDGNAAETNDKVEEKENNPTESAASKSVIQRAADYIKRNYNQPITLDKVASTVYLSPSYFSAQFKKEMGKGFSEYVNEIRIEKSKLLLNQMNLKAYEIAEMVGFNNPKYFTDAFKKHTGVSPRQYRKQKQLENVGE